MTSFLKHVGVQLGAICLALALTTACDDGGDENGGETGETGDGDGDASGDGDGDAAGDGDGDGGELSHAGDIQPIWDTNCTNSGCHMPGGTAEFLDLSGDASDNLVGVLSGQATELQLVEAGNAANSYLINKLRGTHADVGGSGNPMPLGMDAMPLPEATIVMVETWIDGGALP